MSKKQHSNKSSESKVPLVKSRLTVSELREQVLGLSQLIGNLTSRLNRMEAATKQGEAVADRLSPEGFWIAIKEFWDSSSFTSEFVETTICQIDESTLFQLAAALNELGKQLYQDFTKQGRNAIVYKSIEWPTLTIKNVPGVTSWLDFISTCLASCYAVYDAKWQNYVVYIID